MSKVTSDDLGIAKRRLETKYLKGTEASTIFLPRLFTISISIAGIFAWEMACSKHC